MSDHVPDFVQTLRTAKAMFAPASPHIEYGPQSPEYVGVSDRDGKYHLWASCDVGATKGGAQIEVSVTVCKKSGAVVYAVEANFGAPGAQSPTEMVVWAELVQHVAQAACRVEAYLRHEYRHGFINPNDIESWVEKERAGRC